jgi:hypothetical protein
VATPWPALNFGKNALNLAKAAQSRIEMQEAFEPVSGKSRTCLRHANTEIGKSRAETGAEKPAFGEPEFEDLPA